MGNKKSKIIINDQDIEHNNEWVKFGLYDNDTSGGYREMKYEKLKISVDGVIGIITCKQVKTWEMGYGSAPVHTSKLGVYTGGWYTLRTAEKSIDPEVYTFLYTLVVSDKYQPNSVLVYNNMKCDVNVEIEGAINSINKKLTETKNYKTQAESCFKW
jgi:hypothetical protein